MRANLTFLCVIDTGINMHQLPVLDANTRVYSGKTLQFLKRTNLNSKLEIFLLMQVNVS